MQAQKKVNKGSLSNGRFAYEVVLFLVQSSLSIFENLLGSYSDCVPELRLEVYFHSLSSHF